MGYKVLEEDFLGVLLCTKIPVFKMLIAWWCHSYNSLQMHPKTYLAQEFLIKASGKFINLPATPLSNNITFKTWCFNFDVQMVLMMEKTKNSWLKLNLCQSIFLTAVVMGVLQGLLSWVSKIKKDRTKPWWWCGRHNFINKKKIKKGIVG